MFENRENLIILHSNTFIINSKNASPIGKFYSLNITF